MLFFVAGYYYSSSYHDKSFAIIRVVFIVDRVFIIVANYQWVIYDSLTNFSYIKRDNYFTNFLLKLKNTLLNRAFSCLI